jgi:hypothetical protein
MPAPPGGIDRGIQRVLVRVGEIGVHAPSGAHHVARVAAHVIGKPEPRLDVVPVGLHRLAEVVEDGSREPASRTGRLHHLKVRIAVLIERHAGHEVIPGAKIDGHLAGHAPVVLHVARVEIERDIHFDRPADHHDLLHRTAEVVGAHCEEPRHTRLRADVQARFVQPVRPCLQVVFEATESASRPAHIVAELPFALFCRLRRRLIRATGDAIREYQHRLRRTAWNQVLEGGGLEDELVQLRAAEHPVVVRIDGVELVGARRPRRVRGAEAGPTRRRIAVMAVTHREVMAAAQIRADLAREQVLAYRNWKHTVFGGKQAQRVDRLLRVLLRAFKRGKVKNLVVRDRSTDTAAVLVTTVFLFVGAACCSSRAQTCGTRQGFRHRARVQPRIAQERDGAAVHVVGAALRDDIQHRGAAAVLRVETLGVQVELLNSLEGIKLREAADGIVVVVAAVNHVVDVPSVAAADLRRVFRRLRGIGMKTESNTGYGRGQVGELPAIERQSFDASQVDDLSNRRGGGRNQRRVAHDSHGFRNRCETQRQVQVRSL